MFQDISSKVMADMYEAVVKVVQDLYSKCNINTAWDTSDAATFIACTSQISFSNARIHGSMSDIEIFASIHQYSNMTIQAQLGQLMEDVELNPFSSVALEKAINYIKKESSSFTSESSCLQQSHCRQVIRKIILQLKMIEWGLFGLGESTAGMYLANYFTQIGPYFGNINENDWPHTPFHEEPTNLEMNFNEHMMKTTLAITRGQLRKVSILDLIAFGSSIAQLDKNQAKESNWPVEMNFEVLKQTNVTLLFTNYKKLLGDWDSYMDQINLKESEESFTSDMKSNMFTNFTSYIKSDMKTFLTMTSGSTLSTSKEQLSLWSDVAQIVFKHTKSDGYVKKNAQYDKLIFDCAFKTDLQKKKFGNSDQGGCEFFHPTLTTNGMCHTFNGDRIKDVWRPYPVVKVFHDVFQENNSKENFGGAGQVQGNFNSACNRDNLSKTQILLKIILYSCFQFTFRITIVAEFEAIYQSTL